jgi:hypothetical protein
MRVEEVHKFQCCMWGEEVHKFQCCMWREEE